MRTCCGGFGRRGHLSDQRNEIRFIADVRCVRRYLSRVIGRRTGRRVRVLSVKTKAKQCDMPLTRRKFSIATIRLMGRGLKHLGRGNTKIRTCRKGTVGLGGFSSSSFSMALLFKPVCRLRRRGSGLTTLQRTIEIAEPKNEVLITCVVGRFSIVACTFGRGRVLRTLRRKVLARSCRYASGTGPLCSVIHLRSVRTLSQRMRIEHQRVVTTSNTTGCVHPFLGTLARRRFSTFLRCRLTAYRQVSLVNTDNRAISVLIGRRSRGM